MGAQDLGAPHSGNRVSACENGKQVASRSEAFGVFSLPRPLVLRGWSCAAGERAARLRHSWIKNEIRIMEPIDIVSLRRRGTWPPLEVQFPNRLREARDLALDLPRAFSASALVQDLEPLRRLSEADRAHIGDALDERLVTAWNAVAIANELLDATQRLTATYKRVIAAWSTDPLTPASERALTAGWESLREEAENLYRALQKLPTGYLAP